MTDTGATGTTGPRLEGSRDDELEQTYYPPRAFAVDGSLRPLRRVALHPEGTLYTWTDFGDQCFGQVDLPDGVRVQTVLGGAPPHAIGDRYRLVEVPESPGEWRFDRV